MTSETRKRLEMLAEDFKKNGLDGELVKVVVSKARKLSVGLGLEIDEDYHCKCLSCGAIILCGPQCCDQFKSQYMVDEELKGKAE